MSVSTLEEDDGHVPPSSEGAPYSVPVTVEDERGLYGWVSTVDHKRIGILYLVTALAFFAAGGIEALLIRLQLARPNSHLISPDTYNQIFTMHGTTMIFLVVMPALVGFANYLVPLMIGARDMAFPRLNAMSYWLFPFGGLLLHFSFLTGGAPSAGWFSYAPLSETPFSSTQGTDYWIIAVLVLGVGSVAGGINVIATVLALRAPGLTIRRLPLFVWMTFITAILIVLALPVLNASLVMLLIDRQLDAHFFLPAGGGSAVLWQHFFWAFGHPEVYIMALPAFGMISEVIPVFSRKPIFGYEFVAGSTIAIAVLSFGVWAHHMFAVGMGRSLDLFFAAGSMLIAVPTGVKIFNWVATLWGGSIRFTTAMLFAVAFLLQFVIGGLSGITFASAPIDWQMTDTYYVVAHFHYVLFGGTAFGIFAGTYYWFPKMSGRRLDEGWGKVHFWLTVVGFNMTFFVQHLLGFIGMPRRVYTYPDVPGWGALNLVSTLGAVVMGISVLVFVANVVASLRRGEAAGDNPWDAWTLEWATSSPPPPHNFDALPEIHGRRPLWDLAHAAADGEARPAAQASPAAPASGPKSRPPAEASPDGAASGPKSRRRAEASPDGAASGPKPRPPAEAMKDDLPTFDVAKIGVGAFVVSEAGFFLILILAYVFFTLHAQAGPTPASALDVRTTGAFTLCLLASSATLHWAEQGLRSGSAATFRGWLAVTIALGSVFMLGQAHEYQGLFGAGVMVSTNLFATSFFTLTGFHGLHVTLGLVALAIVLGLALAGDFQPAPGTKGRAKGTSVVEAIAIYWHFVDVVWIAVFAVVYLRALR